MKCVVNINLKIQKELNYSMWIKGVVFTIIGSLGMLSYIAITMFIENVWMEVFLWVMAFIFAIGLIYLISIKKTNKQVLQANIKSEIDIQEEFVTFSSIKNNEIVSTNKCYYKDLIKIKETDNYLFLYINKFSAIPIPRNSFSAEEYSLIKLWVNSSKIKKQSNTAQ